jgi:hypothetical protein
VTDVPWGHVSPAHEAFGWCCKCPDRDAFGELLTWRSLWMRDHGAPDIDMDRYARPMGDL